MRDVHHLEIASIGFPKCGIIIYLLQHQVLFLNLDPTNNLKDEFNRLPRLLKAASSNHRQKLHRADGALGKGGRCRANSCDVVDQALRPCKGNILENLEGGGGKSGLGEAFAQLRDGRLQKHWIVLGDKAEEREKGKGLSIRAVGKDRDEGHDVLLDQLPIDCIDCRKHSAQAVVARDD